MVAELPSDIVSLEDFDESINMLIYGDSGIGKTVFAGGAGLILGVEKGTVSAKRQGSKAKLWKIHKWEDIQKAYSWIRKNPDHGFPWIAIDSGTEMQELALRWILAKEFKLNSSRDPDIPQIQDHQKWQNMFKRFIKAFCDLPVNILFTALPLRAEDEEGETLLVPDFKGKGYGISSWVCAQMSVVGHMSKIRKLAGEDENGKKKYKDVRRIYFQHKTLANGGTLFAKDRYDVLGRYQDDKTLVEIAAMIDGTPVPSEKPGKPRKAATKPSKVEPEPEETEDPDGDEDAFDDSGEEKLETEIEEVDELDLSDDDEEDD